MEPPPKKTRKYCSLERASRFPSPKSLRQISMPAEYGQSYAMDLQCVMLLAKSAKFETRRKSSVLLMLEKPDAVCLNHWLSHFVV